MHSQYPSPSSGDGGALKIVLIVFGVIGLVVVLICGGMIGLAYYAASQAKTFVADASRKALTDMVEQSEMDEEDKQTVVAQIDRVTDDFKSGKITLEQVGNVMEELGRSPLFVLMMVRAAEEKYVKPSGLSEEEKAAATLTLERTARGVYEEKIAHESLEGPMRHISQTDRQGNQQLKERVTDEELRAFLAECKTLADGASIPEERFDVDIGDEFKKAVDRALEEAKE